MLVAVSMPAHALADPAAAGEAKSPAKAEHIYVKEMKHAPREEVTFLGVEVIPAGPALASQIGLAKDTGLVVNVVVPDSPAIGVIEPFDVLTKFEDQILIEPRQLSVLVRSKNAGDEVSLTLVRGGKTQGVKVKLGRHEVPKIEVRLGVSAGALGGTFVGPNMMAAMPRNEAKRVLSLMSSKNGDHAVQTRIIQHRTSGEKGTTIVDLGHSNLVYTDDEGAVELKIDDGRKSLVAKDKDGKVIFSGPINTAEERKGVPAKVLARVKHLEEPEELEFTTDDTFEAPTAAPLPVPQAKEMQKMESGLRAL